MEENEVKNLNTKVTLFYLLLSVKILLLIVDLVTGRRIYLAVNDLHLSKNDLHLTDLMIAEIYTKIPYNFSQ